MLSQEACKLYRAGCWRWFVTWIWFKTRNT